MYSSNSILNLENETMKESFLHLMDGRVKLVILLFITIYAVYTTETMILILLEIYLLLLVYLSQISFKTTLKRVLLLLPFGGLIIAFQPFIHAGALIYVLPFGINVTYEGLTFGILLMSRLIVSLTAIVLLSAISPMQEVVQSFRKLGMPREFAMIFSLMIRFLFMFFDELDAIRNAQTARNFDIFNKKTSYMWRLKQVGYTVMMMFLRAYERGETVYMSMISRGYSDNSKLYNERSKGIGRNEQAFVATTLLLVICLQLTVFLFPKISLLSI